MTDGVFLNTNIKKIQKSDRCIEELMQIAEITGINSDIGIQKRKEAIKVWIERWVHEYEHNQAYIKTNFSEEEKDFIREYSKYIIINQLMEECVKIDGDKKYLKMKVRALKTQ